MKVIKDFLLLLVDLLVEAAQIALRSGQIERLKFGNELYTEDLY